MLIECSHENADHLMPGDYYSNGKLYQSIVVTVEQLRCADCGAWLSLGPANDGGNHAQQVAVELRAAEMAIYFVEHGNFVGCASAEEMSGWSSHMLDRDVRYRKRIDEKRHKAQAGYLTRAMIYDDY